MMDLQNLMKQAKSFQEQMARIQGELAGKQVSSTAGGGMVTAMVNGRNELVSLLLEKEVVNPADHVMLQDLIMAAVNDAMNKAREMARTEMAGLTGGLNIPGIF